MTEEQKNKWIKEVYDRGYTTTNFICVNGNPDTSIAYDKEPRLNPGFPTGYELSINWGNMWVFLRNAWAEFKPGMAPDKERVIENYEIY